MAAGGTASAAGVAVELAEGRRGREMSRVNRLAAGVGATASAVGTEVAVVVVAVAPVSPAGRAPVSAAPGVIAPAIAGESGVERVAPSDGVAPGVVAVHEGLIAPAVGGHAVRLVEGAVAGGAEAESVLVAEAEGAPESVRAVEGAVAEGAVAEPTAPTGVEAAAPSRRVAVPQLTAGVRCVDVLAPVGIVVLAGHVLVVLVEQHLLAGRFDGHVAHMGLTARQVEFVRFRAAFTDEVHRRGTGGQPERQGEEEEGDIRLHGRSEFTVIGQRCKELGPQPARWRWCIFAAPRH